MDLGCDASFAAQLMEQLSNPSPQLGAPSSGIVPPGPDAVPPKDGSGNSPSKDTQQPKKKPKAKAKAPKEARLCRYPISDDPDPCVPDVSVDSVF